MHVLYITRTKESRIVYYSVFSESHGNVLVLVPLLLLLLLLLLLQQVDAHLNSSCTAIQSLRKNMTLLL